MSSSRSGSAAFRLLIVLLAAAGLGLASQFEIPFEPVPVTLQSLAVILIGFWLGPVGASAATAIWLAAGALGLPLFAGGEGGIEHLGGATAGYLLAFPLAAALAGYFRGQSRGFVRLFLAAIAAHALILTLGGSWLALQIGPGAAMDKGVSPFILGSVIKSAIAAVLVYGIGLSWPRSRSRR